MDCDRPFLFASLGKKGRAEAVEGSKEEERVLRADGSVDPWRTGRSSRSSGHPGKLEAQEIHLSLRGV